MKQKNKGYFNLDKSYKYTLNKLHRGRLESAPIKHICNIPHRAITIDDNLNCLLCICDGWLPIPVGSVNDFNSIEEVFQGDVAKILQSDIDSKKYTWCAVEHCGIKKHNIQHEHYTLIVNIDRSCNLQCPSCRREKYLVTDGELYNKKVEAANKILQWLENFNKPIRIITSGDGDPLASLIMRPIIKNWKFKKNQNLLLKTNGLLIKKQLKNSELLDNIEVFDISIDAGSKDVYEKIRLGGSWEVLIDNFDFLFEKNKQDKTVLNFALQNDNFSDLYNFADICERYQFRGVVHQLDDWGTWNDAVVLHPDEWTQKNGYFFDHDVLAGSHVNFEKCKNMVSELKGHELIEFSPAVIGRLDLHESN